MASSDIKPAKLTQAIETGRAKTRASLAKSKATSGTPGIPWKTSLWSCCVPFDLYLTACFCPCITFGKTDHRIENDGDMTAYKPFNSPCAVFCALHSFMCLSPIYQAITLQHMREKYNLEGSVIGDVLKAGCCLVCSLVQAEKESTLLSGTKSIGIDGVADEQYARGAGEKMVMAPRAKSDTDILLTPLTRISEETPTLDSQTTATKDSLGEATLQTQQSFEEASHPLIAHGTSDSTPVPAKDATAKHTSESGGVHV